MPTTAPALSRSLTCWALVGFLVRAMVPTGFMLAMPVAGADLAWPVAPCPGQDHGILHTARTTSEQTQHSEHPAHPDRCDSDCFLGLTFALVAELDAGVTVSELLVRSGSLVSEPQPTLVGADIGDGRPRAPPPPA